MPLGLTFPSVKSEHQHGKKGFFLCGKQLHFVKLSAPNTYLSIIYLCSNREMEDVHQLVLRS